MSDGNYYHLRSRDTSDRSQIRQRVKSSGSLQFVFRRLKQYWRKHGSSATLQRVLCVLKSHLMRPVVLILVYYPSVVREVVRWALRTSPTVLRVIDGQRSIESGRFAIFVMWQPESTPWYVFNALHALHEVGANVVLVANHSLCDTRLAELAPLCANILIRDNTGLDLGAYKDAVSYLAGRRIRRLLLLNDSVYYFKDGLPNLFQRLFSSSSDLSASHENLYPSRHAQSFCLSVSENVIQSTAFQEFWRRYIPVQSRRWAIHKGEIALSKALSRPVAEAEILYRADDLGSADRQLGVKMPADTFIYLPLHQRLRLKLEPDVPLSSELLTLVVRQASQIHTGGFLFRELCGAPLLKRDLVFRQQFTADESEALLQAVGHEGHVAEIMSDLIRKGPPPAYGSLQHAKWALGLI